MDQGVWPWITYCPLHFGVYLSSLWVTLTAEILSQSQIWFDDGQSCKQTIPTHGLALGPTSKVAFSKGL